MRKVVQLRGLLVQHHFIVDGDDVHLLDGGMVGGIRRIKKALREVGKDLRNVRSIIISHGHLDHTLNVAKLQMLTGCEVLAPLRDRDHLEGRHRYRGWSRVGGGLEKIGRLALPYRVPKVDRWFNDGDLINGLRVIALPGHTEGHCGFLLPEEKLLLAGDLFTNHFGKPTMPPRIFNDDHAEARRSLSKAAAMDLDGIFLNHTWQISPEEALLALIDLADDL